jgi:hypothetical protein
MYALFSPVFGVMSLHCSRTPKGSLKLGFENDPL